ncbi:hypothetical protein GCM10009761_21270 [Agromyces terreus]
MSGEGSEASGAMARPGSSARRFSVNALLDGFFFVYAGVAAVWLAWLVFTESFAFGWWGIAFFIAFWLLLAYLVLPRLHRILTAIYVPDYFMGRTRTSDGLLGDPVNLALDGDEQAVHASMSKAGWTRADDITLATSWRIITSTVTRRSYDEAPVSPLFLFGRQQDFAYQQEVEGNPARRHHVRFWRTPDGWLLPGGRRVDWLAAGTFDRAVGFSLFTLQITHKIDADTDVERDHIVATVLAADPEARVEVLRDFSTGYHSRNGGGDSIRTDGDLPVLELDPTAGAAANVTAGMGADAAASRSADAAVSQSSTTERHHRERDPRKRAAFESPAALARPVEVEPTMARPTAITLGSVLVVLRALAGVVWLITLAVTWRPVLRDEFGFDPAPGTEDDQGLTALLIAILVVGALGLLVVLLFGLAVYRGSNVARLLVMAFASSSITIAAIDYFAGDEEITVRTTLLTLALDILVLLALSSRAARAYARRPRAR